ncbi:MAG: GyrI-like domain-containing protein [Gaiellaceae bacterium]
MDLGIELRKLEPERMLAIELTTSSERFDADLSAAFGRIGEVLTGAGAVFSGAGICMHPKRRTLPGRIAAVAAIPFEGQIEPAEGMEVIELGGGDALVGILRGPYEQLAKAWVEMNNSLAKGERPRPKTAPYDRFLRSMVNVVTPDELITELVIPLA